MKRRTFITSLTISTSSVLAGCSQVVPSVSENKNKLMDEEIISESYDYNMLERKNLPQVGGRNYEVNQLENLPDVVTLKQLESLSYLITQENKNALHPVGTARRLLSLFELYHAENDEEYKNKAREVAEAFVEKSTRHDDGIYFPYEFTFPNGVYTFEKPWYSGMAQGIALSAYTRGYSETGDTWYQNRANEIFETLITFPANRGTKPWVAAIDEKGYYWIEEYPKPYLTHTLNGFNFAIWGIYEYWLSKSSELSKRALDASITTVKNHLQDYRRPNKTSRYWLGATHSNPISYHNIHIRQLEKLYNLTGDHYFQMMAQAFENDVSE